MASTSDIRKGLVIDMNDDLWSVVDFLHVKPGKGAAFVRTKLKSLTTGKTLENTFPAGSKFETARVEKRPHQFLYKDDMGYHFMDQETFTQLRMPEELINSPQFLVEGASADVLIHAETEQPLTCELPQHVTLEITYTEPGVRGDTATNATKPATVESGAEINVPLFVNEGDNVKVDTTTGEYLGREN